MMRDDNLNQALADYANAYASEALAAFGAALPTGWVFRKANSVDIERALEDDDGGTTAEFWARHWVIVLQFYLPVTNQWATCTTYHDLGGNVPVEDAIREFIRRLYEVADDDATEEDEEVN